ncbi:hypothetical protein QYF36_011234 [Acer negundo]|nr:hypothetical protein QYF36_011234 [Acer negundo]
MTGLSPYCCERQASEKGSFWHLDLLSDPKSKIFLFNANLTRSDSYLPGVKKVVMNETELQLEVMYWSRGCCKSRVGPASRPTLLDLARKESRRRGVAGN